MNVHAKEFLTETPLSMRRHLQDAITIYGSDSTYDEEIALDAILAGRPAFWSTAKYHSACAGILLRNLNHGLSFEDAIADAYCPWQRGNVEHGLDSLVPLNLKAANALSLAYSHHTATWHDEEELLMRRVRDCRRAA